MSIREEIERELVECNKHLEAISNAETRETNASALTQQALRLDRAYHEGRRDGYLTALSLLPVQS